MRICSSNVCMELSGILLISVPISVRLLSEIHSNVRNEIVDRLSRKSCLKELALFFLWKLLYIFFVIYPNNEDLKVYFVICSNIWDWGEEILMFKAIALNLKYGSPLFCWPSVPIPRFIVEPKQRRSFVLFFLFDWTGIASAQSKNIFNAVTLSFHTISGRIFNTSKTWPEYLAGDEKNNNGLYCT